MIWIKNQAQLIGYILAIIKCRSKPSTRNFEMVKYIQWYILELGLLTQES